MTAAFAAMLAASAPLAFAQTTGGAPAGNGAATTTHSAAPAEPHAAAKAGTETKSATEAKAGSETQLKPGQMLFSKMNGATVYDTENKDIGDINNVVLDKDGKVAAVVIKSGGFVGIGGKTIAVGMNDLKMTTDKDGKLKFTLAMIKAQVDTAQTYDVNPPKTATGSSTPPAGHPAPATAPAPAGNHR